MVATPESTSFILNLPLGDCSEYLSNPILDHESAQEVVGPSTISVHVSPRPEDRGCSLVPLASLLDLGVEFPLVKSLHLRSVLVQLDASPRSPADVPRFSFLESLSIDPWFSQLSGDAAVTKSLLALFPHMPRLRNLSVYAPMARPHVEHADHELHYPDPPFRLERLVCFGTLSVLACAHLIAHSRGTLRELRINIVGHADAEESVLIAALARAAPRLRVLDLRLRGDGRLMARFKPVFAALARVQTVQLETPRNVRLHDALALLAGVPARTLVLRSPQDRHEPGAVVDIQLVLVSLHAPRLRNVTFLGFDIGGEDRGALITHCLARRMIYRIGD